MKERIHKRAEPHKLLLSGSRKQLSLLSSTAPHALEVLHYIFIVFFLFSFEKDARNFTLDITEHFSGSWLNLSGRKIKLLQTKGYVFFCFIIIIIINNFIVIIIIFF